MIKVGVIRGGVGSQYEVSLKTGSNILSHLRGDKLNSKYKAIDILIDKEGIWHINGKPVTILDVFNSIDVIFNALHGDFGEDGKVAQVFDQWKIPYTGSTAFASALSYNKFLAKKQFELLNIKTPEYLIAPRYKSESGPQEHYAKEVAKQVHTKIPSPWIIKPLSGGSSLDVVVCKTYLELINFFQSGLYLDKDILIEEYIEGKEAVVCVVDNFRDKDIYVLPSVEVRLPKDRKFYDYNLKHLDILEEVCPGNFKREEKEELEKLASQIHKEFNLSHYSKSDFIIHPKKGIYVLEVNTLPSLTSTSQIPKMLTAVGSDTATFIDHILKLALNK